MLPQSDHEVSDFSSNMDANTFQRTTNRPSMTRVENHLAHFKNYKHWCLRIGLLLIVSGIGTMIFVNDHQSSHAQSLEDGLIVWLKLDEGAGAFATDSSGSNNAGTLQGGDWILGRFGNAVDLINPSQNNFEPDWIEIAPAENQNLNNEVTLAAWVKPVQLTNGSGIITKGENITSYAMRLTDSGQVRFTANFGEPFGWQGAGDWDSFTTIGTDEWHHIAVTYDGTNIRFFLDGVKDDNKPAVDLLFGRATQPIFIGADLPDDDQLLDGAVDDIRIYNRALSTGEIESLATPPNQAPVLILPEKQTSLEGDSIALSIQASDPEGQALEFNIAGLPRGLDFDSTIGLVSGIIDQGTQGTYSVDIEVADPQGNVSSGSFLWEVRGAAPTKIPTPLPTNTPTDTTTDTPTEIPTDIPTGVPTDSVTPTPKPTEPPLSPSPTVQSPTEQPPTATTKPEETTVPPTAVATPTPSTGQLPVWKISQSFRHFEDQSLDGRISTGDRLLFQTIITNTGTITITDVEISQTENSELALVPNSIWLVQGGSGSGTQLTDAQLPLSVSAVSAESSISILYVMEVRLSHLVQTSNIESIATLQVPGEDTLFAPPVAIPVVRPPMGLSNGSSMLLFLPVVE